MIAESFRRLSPLPQPPLENIQSNSPIYGWTRASIGKHATDSHLLPSFGHIHEDFIGRNPMKNSNMALKRKIHWTKSNGHQTKVERAKKAHGTAPVFEKYRRSR
ncbi:hypothetical protein [Paenibacillus sp. CECT 9249]|uniref:hypothetical protein n=1 Tax=Paenibacillus sp. CECT 9249 TaxID=2845385 RepID=UPI001E5D06FB|nr:hypothetical protein [Paenibacillus sp. CECT 9249]